MNRIRQTFLYLVDGDFARLSRIDAKTIKLIKSRAPGLSQQDLIDLEQDWNEGKLFRYMETQERNLAWDRLKTIDYPIPTLETFFQDILFLEVGQTVMKQLCLLPLVENRTIDNTLRGQAPYQVSASGQPLTSNMREQNARICDLWRFSLQYAFELTHKKDHHRRVPRKTEDKLRASSLGLNDRLVQSPLSLLHHFLCLARSYGFAVPSMGLDQFDTMDLPQYSPSDFPADSSDDVGIERRSGKPFTDSIDADRFALSRESLNSSWPGRRVSAGFIRRCVFNFFFSYLRHNGSDNHNPNQISTWSQEGNTLGSVQGSHVPSVFEASSIPHGLMSPSTGIPTPAFHSYSPGREAEFVSVFGDMPWDLHAHSEVGF